MPSDDDKYSVGWGKPPRETRFKKGRSGNAKGRPKGSKNISTVLADVLNTRVPATVNGRRRLITMLYAVMKQLVNKAASGDPRSIQILLNEIRQIQSHDALFPAQAPQATERPRQLSAQEQLDWSLEVMRILRDLGQFDEIFGKTAEIGPQLDSSALIKKNE
jgi:hypothetical protein